MKKLSVFALAGLLCLITIGCGKQEEIKSGTQEVEVLKEELVKRVTDNTEGVTEAIPASQADIVVEMENTKRVIANEEKAELIKIEENYPIATIGGKEEASDKINEFYRKEKEKFAALTEKDGKNAEKSYKERQKNADAVWAPYEMSKKHELARADSAVISVICKEYLLADVQTSGVLHISTDNFRPETGERLKFTEIVIEEEGAREFVKEYIQKSIEDLDKKGEKEVPFLMDNNWYFSQIGFVVIVNMSMITEEVTEFTIPYQEFTFLKEEYK